MSELESLKQEAETLKNTIQVSYCSQMNEYMSRYLQIGR